MKKTLLVLSILLLFSWCNIKNTSFDVNNNIKVVNIWTVIPLSSSSTSNYWEDWANIWTYLVNKFNNENTWVQVNLIIEDGKCNTKDAVSAAEKLINIDKVDLFVWWGCSSEGIAVWQLAQQNEILFINWISSAPDLSNIWDWIYNYKNDLYAGKRLAEFLNKKVESIVLIYENTSFGKWLKDVIESEYTWEILQTISLNTDENNLYLLIKQIEDLNPDWIVLMNQSEEMLSREIIELNNNWLLEQYKEKIFWAYVFASQRAKENIRDLLEWAYQVNVSDVDTFWEKWVEFFDEISQNYSIQAVPSYDLIWAESLNIALDAIKQWNYDSLSIKNYLESITKNNYRSWLIWDYYIDDNQAIWIKYSIQQVANWDLVTVE